MQKQIHIPIARQVIIIVCCINYLFNKFVKIFTLYQQHKQNNTIKSKQNTSNTKIHSYTNIFVNVTLKEIQQVEKTPKFFGKIIFCPNFSEKEYFVKQQI
eukprot:TRINITY_DN9828_c1_g1_i1.p2 TRINITY_DN9828_c1_g1~~TRINITY_DN9828_c1_g1_i1.p2  ORF type:complete len:100 (+),score=2.16 TRINITY_DN9828_c1_g1_i1:420-719(+)